MNQKERRIYISNVKRMARSKAGLAIIEKISPEAALAVKAHPDWLEIPQSANYAPICGVYVNNIYGKPFYIGSSGNIYFRLCEHIFNYMTSARYYGGVYTLDTPARFEIYDIGLADEKKRESLEFDLINETHPLLQFTEVSDSLYGRDKPIAKGKTRETIRPDICIYSYLRPQRFEEAKASYQKRGI